jgi:hypothetical protein
VAGEEMPSAQQPVSSSGDMMSSVKTDQTRVWLLVSCL